MAVIRAAMAVICLGAPLVLAEIPSVTVGDIRVQALSPTLLRVE